MNVYEATQARLKFLFDNFEQIIVSFSGGKDSGVLLNLAVKYARSSDQLNKLAVYYMDYEAQYTLTDQYVQNTMDSLPRQVKKYWIALPIKAQCATSMFQNYWTPWNPVEENIWVKSLPQDSINETNFPFDFDYHVWDYEFNNQFAKSISKKSKTCFLIGIRDQESLHRYKATHKTTHCSEYKNRTYTTIDNGVVNAYPIHDWLVEDIWACNAKQGFKYDHIYDLMYEAGVKLSQMRVASPFNDAATQSLKLFKTLDPDKWPRLVGRVNGVNFTAIYGGTKAMGWNGISKPSHFTWKQYAEFLLSTLPKTTRENYERKIKTSIKYWTKDGGALPTDVIEQLPKDLKYQNLGKPQSKRRYTKPYEVLKFNDYLDEVDSKHPNLLPTYKRICIAIMKNDTSMKTLGFGQTKYELNKRKQAIHKYQEIL